jgi:hypothetical protein
MQWPLQLTSRPCLERTPMEGSGPTPDEGTARAIGGPLAQRTCPRNKTPRYQSSSQTIASYRPALASNEPHVGHPISQAFRNWISEAE